MPVHHHRASTHQRQSNKSHKSNHASKRSLINVKGRTSTREKKTLKSGGVGGKMGASGCRLNSSKTNRLQISKKRREDSKMKVLADRRGLKLKDSESGRGSVAPRVIGLISLSEREKDLECLVNSFLRRHIDQDGMMDNSSITHKSPFQFSTVKYSKYRNCGRYLTILCNTTAFYSQYEDKDTQVKCDKGNENINEHKEREDVSIQAALDLSRVCDILVFIIDSDTSSTSTSSVIHTSQEYDNVLISPRGRRVLHAIKAQGLPTTITLLVNIINDGLSPLDTTMEICSYSATSSVKKKKRKELKKFINRFSATEFGTGSRSMELDIISFRNRTITSYNFLSIEEPKRSALLRLLCSISASPPKWTSKMPRAYIISYRNGVIDSTNVKLNNQIKGYEYNEDRKELMITGFVRGCVSWDINNLVHIPYVGTFAAKAVTISNYNWTNFYNNTPDKYNEKYALRKRYTPMDIDDEDTSICQTLILESKKSQRESTDMFAPPDAFLGEQNLVGFDNDNKYKCEYHDMTVDKFGDDYVRPTGWSDYQSSWLDAVDINSVDNGEDISEEDFDHGELASELNNRYVEKKTTTNDNKLNFFLKPNDGKSEALMEKRQKDKKDELMFPDEVELSSDQKAHIRFARYRSLKSFRRSYWDPKENLPESYGNLYHFNSFKATQRDIISAAMTSNHDIHNDKDKISDENKKLKRYVPFGSFVTLTVENVPPSSFARVSLSSLLTAVCLLPHENKASILHMSLAPIMGQVSENNELDMPVKSKDVLIFRCGWRIWNARPIFYKQNLNCDKHKFEHFLPSDGFYAASVIGPVTFSPTPVLVFRELFTPSSIGKSLVAIGNMSTVDADRIVIKRIVLTGYPIHVRKRRATVKHMFHNSEDVKWFKPAGLTSKYGLHGHILESLGDHGTMKCVFNAPIKQHDTVCLHLFKRIYPKFSPTETVGDDGITLIKKNLIVL